MASEVASGRIVFWYILNIQTELDNFIDRMFQNVGLFLVGRMSMPKTTSANVNSKQDDETGDQYCKTFLSLIQTFPRAAAADRCSAKN